MEARMESPCPQTGQQRVQPQTQRQAGRVAQTAASPQWRVSAEHDAIMSTA
jgi:hypothetical protein